MFDRGDKEFVIDMFLSCQKIKDQKTIDAVVRNIKILGEAVKNISNQFREKYPDIEWSIIARTRDKLIHFYFGVDVITLWKIAKFDIPRLIKKLEGIIKNEGGKTKLIFNFGGK